MKTLLFGRGEIINGCQNESDKKKEESVFDNEYQTGRPDWSKNFIVAQPFNDFLIEKKHGDRNDCKKHQNQNKQECNSELFVQRTVFVYMI